MPIWNLRQSESLLNLREAAIMRYLEGLELIRSGSPIGAVYLLGYAAEIWLKIAFFSYLPDAEDVERRVKEIKKDDRKTAPGIIKPSLAKQYEADFMTDDLHSPRFWADLLTRARTIHGRSLPVGVEKDLNNRMNRLHLNWWVGLRYQDIRPDPSDVQAVWEDVTWIYENLGTISRR